MQVVELKVPYSQPAEGSVHSMPPGSSAASSVGVRQLMFSWLAGTGFSIQSRTWGGGRGGRGVKCGARSQVPHQAMLWGSRGAEVPDRTKASPG